MVQSSEEPQNIQVDWGKLKHGKVDILVHDLLLKGARTSVVRGIEP